MKYEIDAELLYRVLKLFICISLDLKVNIKKKGFEINCMDKTKSFAVMLNLSKDSFAEYEYDKDQEVNIDLTKMTKFLSACNLSDKNITLDFDMEGMEMTMIVGAVKRKTRLMAQAESAMPKAPKLEYDTNFVIKGSELKRYVEAVNIFADIFKIEFDEKHIVMVGWGDMMIDEIEVKINKNDKEILNFEKPKGETKSSMFTTEFPLTVIRSIPAVSDVKVELGNNYPMRIGWSIDEKSDVTAFFAPRIEQD